jgi:ferredoxin-NADP reductase
MILHVQKPEGFYFTAGQFCFITVPDIGIHDQEDFRRPMSIASAPHEPLLVFAARCTDSAFKRTLAILPLASSITLDDAVGYFTLPDQPQAALIFLAGGLGVVPFRSLILHAVHSHANYTITLFYSNRFADEAVFVDEFQAVSRERPNITVIPTVTRGEPPAEWPGLAGRISAEMITARCAEWQQSVYYISGSPAMVDGMKAMLASMGIDQAHLKREIWTGDAA